ncbi:response regulator transcription factor [Nostoc sp. FACHB-110]|uniref:response regulator transcription factor n=1 Tax=Nostoc sp. FACHB-110 TaxID=2692834 RepID=UPI001684AB3A|nr:response regulator transcription factor [Nostoc sp. FACHB-110]MBD2439991.1 response regulator transcription factor [Nostoc sp. FACHB-110]
MDILIVEDEAEIAQLIQISLEKEGFSCSVSRDGVNALRMFQEKPPDLIILDLMIPGLDGLEVCARIRQKPGAKDPYILMLTAKGEEIDRVIGLSTGADDYMVKPFSPRELVARVRALLRRSLRQGGQNQLIRTQSFIVDVEQRTASRQINSQEPEILDLTNLEFNLLTTFVSNPGRVWNRTQLIDKLWGDDFFGDERVVDTHVARLRKKIEPDPASPSFIKTVVGVGYKFEDSPVL